jgi:hypothetical protein
MVPAAIMGLDVERLLDEAERMLHACAPGVPAAENPGLVLGTILGAAALRGMDKLTLVASPGIYDLGAWLEQLIAEGRAGSAPGHAHQPLGREAATLLTGEHDFRGFRVVKQQGISADKAELTLQISTVGDNGGIYDLPLQARLVASEWKLDSRERQ